MTVQPDAKSRAAKETILRRIRAAGPIPDPTIPRDYRVEGDASKEGRAAIIDEMEEALIDYTAVVTRTGEHGLARAITDALADVSSVVIPPGLPKKWQKAAAQACEVRVDDPPLSKAALDGTDAVLTASRVAVSLSGTIMLDGEPDQGRRAITLIPDTHVIVLRAKDIYKTVPEGVAILAEHPDRPTTWIAGPSATSDIELVRVDGVHGPRNLRVIILE